MNPVENTIEPADGQPAVAPVTGSKPRRLLSNHLCRGGSSQQAVIARNWKRLRAGQTRTGAQALPDPAANALDGRPISDLGRYPECAWPLRPASRSPPFEPAGNHFGAFV